MRWKPVDVLTSLFAAALVVAGLARFGNLEDRRILLRMGLVAVVPAVVAMLRGRNPNPSKNLRILLDFYIVVCIVVIFDGLGPLIRAVNPVDKDASLIAFDRWLTGTDPTVALERIATPLLSDVLTVFYALYYFHPIVFGAIVLRDDRERPPAARDFARYAFVMVFVFFVSYVGYFLVPAVGPRFTSLTPGRSREARSRAGDRRDAEHAREQQARLLPVRPHDGRRGRPPRGGAPVEEDVLDASCRSRSGSFSRRSTAGTTTSRTSSPGLALAFVTVPLGNALYRRFSTSR